MPERGRKSFREALQSFAEGILFTKIYFFCALTPELRRTALRPCVSKDHSGLHEAAKRSRLERIVRPVPAVAFDQDPMNLAESRPDDRCSRNAEPRNGVPAALAGTEFVARIKSLGEAREEQRQLSLTLVDRHLFLDRSNA